MNKLSWKTESRRIADLVPFPGNPRILKEKKANDLKKSLQKFNLVEIPAVDHDGTVIAGNQRLKIMRLLGRGEEKIDVRVPNRPLTPDELKEYNARSNISAGEWDSDILANEYDRDDLFDWGFEPGDIGLNASDESDPGTRSTKTSEKTVTCDNCGHIIKI